ncbi:MAG: hypothetical protein JST91_06890 [Actinobacteria bacterium]|nr:hypothetical protein [Actinomycetota bacterium]
MSDNHTPDETTTEVMERSETDPATDVTSGAADTPEGSDSESNPETFPRSYVEELRQENGRYRQRAQQGDAYAQRLHTELVRATGRLADPTDLPFAADHLDDSDKLSLALDELLTRKPHLANRRPAGDIGQGPTPSGGSVDLAAILRQQAQ